jgi:hypothetical protein
MSAPQHAAVEVARAVLDDPRRVTTVSARDMRAICQALVDAEQRSQISEQLAFAIRRMIDAGTGHDDACRDVAAGRLPTDNLPIFVEARNVALAELAARFEEEFPDYEYP